MRASTLMTLGLHEPKFHRLLLPLLAAFNLSLGIAALTGPGLRQWTDAADIAAGAACCVIAGGLIAASLTRRYLTRNMLRQISIWWQFSDAVLEWIEESRMSDETVERLHRSLDRVMAEGRRQGSGTSS